MRQNLTVAGLTLLAIFLMGNPGCDGGTTEDGDTETPTAEPEAVADVVLGGLELARTSIEFGEAAATLVDPPQFNPCMIATGSLAGIVIAEANVPAITEEASDPDGKLDITGGTIDFTRCMDMAGKPDPWPPTEPDANVEAMIKAGVPLGIGVAKSFIEPKIPTEGKKCIEGTVAMAMMDSIGEIVTTTVIDGVNGKDVTSIPNFTVDYSGCGLTFDEEVPVEEAPVEEPAAEPTE